MNKVINYQQVLDAVNAIKESGKGFITNFYPDIIKINRWINSGDFYYSKFEDTLFLYRNNNNFINLFYCSTSKEMLSNALSIYNFKSQESLFVIDLLGKDSDIKLLKEIFKNNNFSEYVSLCRMSKNTENINETINDNLKYAKIEHANDLLYLLNTYFDPIAEQLPSYEEILKWINERHIMIYESEGKINGFMIYDLIGLTSYLRYWFVHPEHRNAKIGSILLNNFFTESNKTKRQLFWVIQSNDNAIKRYKHYGFVPENLYDYVLTNKNIYYETESD